MAIRLTKPQRKKLFGYGVGVGIIAWKSAEGTIVETEFYVDDDGVPRIPDTFQELLWHVEYGDDHDKHSVSLRS